MSIYEKFKAESASIEMGTYKYEHYANSGRENQHNHRRISYQLHGRGDRSEEGRSTGALAIGFWLIADRAEKFWEDNEDGLLESRLTEIMVDMLIQAEAQYRSSLVRHREWIIEQKAAAKAELQRRKEEAERKERERQEKLARERIARLLSQAKALDRANRIRAYVEAARSRAEELLATQADIDKWAHWACAEADRIDPVRNGIVKPGYQRMLGRQYALM